MVSTGLGSETRHWWRVIGGAIVYNGGTKVDVKMIYDNIHMLNRQTTLKELGRYLTWSGRKKELPKLLGRWIKKRTKIIL